MLSWYVGSDAQGSCAHLSILWNKCALESVLNSANRLNLNAKSFRIFISSLLKFSWRLTFSPIINVLDYSFEFDGSILRFWKLINCFYFKITLFFIFSWLVLLGSCVPTMFMLLVFVILSWQEKCVCLNPDDEEDDDPHIRPPPRCATHASAVITNTRWLRVIIFVTSASFICATSLISIVSLFNAIGFFLFKSFYDLF